MGIINALKNWSDRKENSDLKRVKITESGAFYMKSEDLFNDKEETLALLKKLNKSIDNHIKGNENNRSTTK